jgi:hypothetical protein
MKKTFLLSVLMTSLFLNAQDADTLPKNWRLKSIYGINGSQSAFVNWNAGGRNNFALLGFIVGEAKYKKKAIKWDTDIALALGAVNYIGPLSETDQRFQKTDDKIELATNLGYRLKEYYYVSLLGSFRTQMVDGFTYPDITTPVSRFMAPGYSTVAIGIDYTPNDNLTLFVSPLSAKMTFVKSAVLADAGAFGVEGATYDDLGNLLTEGKQFRGEFGAYLRMKYNRSLAKNIDFKSKLELFSNYVNNPQNIDVNAEILFSFKVNGWLSTSLQWNLIYDDDIDVRDGKGNIGPRTQFKSVLGLGISFSLQNYIDEKK